MTSLTCTENMLEIAAPQGPFRLKGFLGGTMVLVLPYSFTMSPRTYFCMALKLFHSAPINVQQGNLYMTFCCPCLAKPEKLIHLQNFVHLKNLVHAVSIEQNVSVRA